LIEFDVVISDHGTILSIQKVSLFGIFAGWKIINWVQILVVDSAFELGFGMVEIVLSESRRTHIENRLTLEIILGLDQHWIHLHCFGLRWIKPLVVLFCFSFH
jgi:hypothetical protein